MSYLNALLSDLRDRKLWPVAVLLLAAIVAVPVVLSKSPAPAPAPSGSIGTPVAEAHTGAAVTVEDSAVQAPLGGSGRDPFTQQKLSSGSTTTSSGGASGVATIVARASAAAGPGAPGSTAATGSTPSSGSTGSTGSTGSPAPAVSPSTPSSPPTASKPAAPASSGLRSDEAYDVAVSVTDAGGGLNAIDPFERDRALPSDQRPELVELGVLQGAHSVLFAVQPGATFTGPGTCVPGPLDCEILQLAPGQTEGISATSGVGTVTTTLFQVTGIGVQHFSSAAAAGRARAATDPVGRALLAGSTASALSLFQYELSLDSVVDQRNLTVGGN
jgi:hypothetical protein